MKIGDWRRLTDYWERHPPACELLEFQLKWSPPERCAAVSAAEEEALDAEVRAALGGG